ncbi:MAG: diaminopimelate epimerase [Candidatus Eisenbacteria bacterium]|nr:diaminopimelate epimerase [Candidatus Eisenbacteria bacterium]
MTLEFAKMTGAGNDFIVVDDRDMRIQDDARELAKHLCRRRVSVGADGLILVVPSTRCDFRMRYLNADGSEADLCGNGGRCVARFANEVGIAGRTMTFESRTGTHRAEIVSDESVRLAMPDPRALILDVELPLKGRRLTVHRVNTGVPHAVAEVEDLEDYPVVEIGRMIREHGAFVPEGTNADFVSVLDGSTIELRTYERGVEDETLACGTGAVAAAIIEGARGRVTPPVSVRTRGGPTLTVDFFMSDMGFCDVTLTGEARIVYRGTLTQSEDQ